MRMEEYSSFYFPSPGRAAHHVCGVLSFICYPATCGPKGHGSGSAAAEATAVGFFTYPVFPGHRPAEPVIVGPPPLLHPEDVWVVCPALGCSMLVIER